MNGTPFVYIMASKKRGSLYVGVTSGLVRRAYEHREGLIEGYTKRRGITTLVWFERHPTMASAIAREKAIKRWPRAWKYAAIEKMNPEWEDLYPSLTARERPPSAR